MVDFFKRFLQRTRSGPQSMEGSQPISEEPTRPMDALLLARALKGEGRRHVAVAMNHLEDRRGGDRNACLYSLVGNYEGLISFPDFAILGVADGSRESRGADRSQRALSSFCQHIIRLAILDLLSPDNFDEGLSLQNAVMDAYQAAGHSMDCIDGSSCLSMTVGLILAEVMILAHRGSTRAYHIDHHHIERITSDSFPSQSPAAGFGGNRRNSSNIPKERPDSGLRPDQIVVYSRPVPRDGYLMLCTEGFWKKVDEREIYRIVSNVGDVRRGCKDLLSRIPNPGRQNKVAVALMYFPPAFGL
jgi:serine/threonine protein phosphatase PrpC